MELSKEILEKMQKTNIREVNIEELTDLRNIVIDSSQPVKDKLKQFADQTQNIYVNRLEEYIVKVSYANCNLTINDKIRSYIKKMAEINY